MVQLPAIKKASRPVILAAGAALLLAAGLIVWQLGTRGGIKQTGEPKAGDSSRDSGLVTLAPVAQSPAPASAASTLTAASAAPAAPAPASTPDPIAATTASHTAPPHDRSPNAARYPLATGGTSAAARPLLPQDAVAATRQTLGQHASGRFLYFDPLARRIVATIDGLGQPAAPTTLWLLQPTPGALKTNPAQDHLAAANAERYRRLLRWVERLDNAALLRLYRRLYPMLQQAYVEAGHADGHFNDRVVAVIDQLLAAPSPRGPLRLKLAPARAGSTGSTLPPQAPRYEFADPALEALSTGQKILLRMGPQSAQKLKAKLKLLRAALVPTERAPR
jgi:hypothetical protein